MRLTWWGHSTASITDGGISLLTDPVLGDHIAYLHRRAGGRPPASVCDVDAVLVSHLHADHLDVVSLRRIAPRAVLVVPHGGRGVLRHRAPSLAARCVEVAPGEVINVGHVRVRATPAQHPGSRGPWSRHRGCALGYVIAAGSGEDTVSTWFAGDTGLGEFMSDLGPIDAALLPVGGWGPTLGPEHLDPARAVEALRRVQPRVAVPIHYGTLWPLALNRLTPQLFAPPGREFARLAAEADLATQVCVLQHGESVDTPGSGHRAIGGAAAGSERR